MLRLASHLSAEPEKEPTVVGEPFGGREAFDNFSEGWAPETSKKVQTNIFFSDGFTAEEQACWGDSSVLRQAIERDVAARVARDQLKESLEFVEQVTAVPEDDHGFN
eukprot:TRINITY_DN56241_c0_g1_i1.p1 TRINITY_DN56241_c0_g1~~TRINITY_DN56241_c0_g1_i1.p1  ORF type:complete len:107 (+),score=24.23 TRINITY_DN56241_c0_g1_i1:364-684(+)